MFKIIPLESLMINSILACSLLICFVLLRKIFLLFLTFTTSSCWKKWWPNPKQLRWQTKDNPPPPQTSDPVNFNTLWFLGACFFNKWAIATGIIAAHRPGTTKCPPPPMICFEDASMRKKRGLHVPKPLTWLKRISFGNISMYTKCQIVKK